MNGSFDYLKVGFPPRELVYRGKRGAVTTTRARLVPGDGARVRLHISMTDSGTPATPTDFLQLSTSAGGQTVQIAYLSIRTPNFLMRMEEFGDLVCEDIWAVGSAVLTPGIIEVFHGKPGVL